MVTISAIQLNNISQTIYNLMTGVYNLDYFYSPYNDLIPDDLTEEKGAAYNTYDKILDIMVLLSDTLNKLSGKNKDYPEVESIADHIFYLQSTLCIFSIKRGYRDSFSSDCSQSNLQIPIYEKHLSKAMRTKDGIGNLYYDQLVETLGFIKQKLSVFHNTDADVITKTDNIIPMLDQRFSILCNKAYSYGQNLAFGKLPVWSNPELSYVHYCKTAQMPSLSYEQIIKLYYNASDNWTTDFPAFQCCQSELINFHDCQQKLINKLPVELQEEFNNICFSHSLIETCDLQNIFVQGFQLGLKLTVESLHVPNRF